MFEHLQFAAVTNVSDALTDLFIVLLAAKLGEELFKRIKQPTLVGEILAGLLVGPALLNLVKPESGFELFAELGVIFLLFWVGLQTHISELREVGGIAARVGIYGAFLPLFAGFGLGELLGESSAVSLFLAVALMATSVGITSAVFLELGAVDRPASRTILGAAVIDDILALTLLSVAVGLAADGGISVLSITVTVLLAVGFVLFFGLGGTSLLARWPNLLQKPSFADSPLLPAVIICLGLAALAANLGLAAVVGAFLAGMIVAETKEQHPVEEEIAPLYAFFTPFFFAFVGAQIPLAVFTDLDTLLLLVAVTGLAVLTKAAGAWLGAGKLPASERSLVTVGMVPRGEVGIIVAGIGRAEGVISNELFAVIVGMSILTTLLVPPLLQRRIG